LDTIDRHSPTPYYEQLYDLLQQRVREGAVASKERLPSESELHREYGLSRSTVRQALDLLEANGWATRVPNRGYFASSPPEEHGWLIEGQEGFLESELGHRNRRVRTTVVRAQHAVLPEHACRALQLPDHAEGFVLERIRYLDGDVVLFSTNYTPPDVESVVADAASVLAGQTSLTEALRQGGYVPEGARRVIHALPSPRAVAERLEVAEGSALLRIRSTSWTASSTPYDYYETWLRSDRVPLELSASAHRP
jgi:GntR family transcriptional regulator